MPLLEQWIRALLQDFRAINHAIDQARAEHHAPEPVIDAWAQQHRMGELTDPRDIAQDGRW